MDDNSQLIVASADDSEVSLSVKSSREIEQFPPVARKKVDVVEYPKKRGDAAGRKRAREAHGLDGEWPEPKESPVRSIRAIRPANPPSTDEGGE